MSADAPIVIVGTGMSGYSLAKEIRKQDKDTPIVMVTADDGYSYSKPMLSTGFTKGKEADELAQASAEAMVEQLNLQLRTYTTVTGIDPDAHELVLGDERLGYSKLVLAWGADVIRLSIAGDGHERVFSINDLMDYRAFRKALKGKKRVAIMGAGLIGCEFANDLRNGDVDVDVIAPSDALMPGLLPPAAAAAVRDGLEGLGVRFHLETVVEHIANSGDGVRLTLANGEELESDLVISAVGLRPRTELAAAAGLETQRGIVVNRALETSVPDVYALGDCAEVDGHVLLYVLPLMACARALAKTLVSERTEVKYGTMPVMVKTPCCPTAVCPPPANASGSWEVDADGQDVRALFKSESGEVLGFAVTGGYAMEKQALSKEVPPIHD
ncbi:MULTISPECIES: NAD(P)/FAD-dependent oxidoreductase [Marinobacter]|jgi:rubredoxin-NAD+ reductase|uniref:NAD(P)/FAD-dependent oxidoreductase n=1 Tax=Marinobacter TaxID=2742 RepID=UPI00094919ED|nr:MULTISPECIES: FAD-dependent oxidoreductase [Marinobacter]MBL83039.1 FAD-dependent oxidoreductase [Marinobacter sp.]MCC4283428.1 FAD-dependent oxidoreductase [Marinobacter salarius]MCZ4283895.1 FAD-dependent oxidoreductase [Marinobacter salarius]MDC8456769.1 FAD-dependent oxidoreductase [Marinobacter sp. DS40M6]MDP4531350.1 FAD-dependent oxidoreductase [Marinobacter salarius]|tara:strand:+ start:23777 stop:24931 length:1155 start_codon:yes stop_codon:yes gene_type:complete